MDGFREVTLTTTIGRYQVLEKVGQGGMGVVYRAHDTLLERIVALKVIAASIDDNPELRERFFREARAAGQLSHPNIITIHDLGEHEGRPYLAMEYLLGEDLQRRLARPDPMSLTRKLEIAAEICDGLAFAHRRGVIHRDIKPANVFITDEGVVKILDFGLARMVASEVTASNMMLGTLNYMAPEQVRGERTDHRADIFSFGVVLYELISGKKAFQGDSYATTLYKILQDVPEPLLSLDPSLPPDLVKVVDRSLAKAREERYQDLTDVVRDLALVRQHFSVSSYVAPATLSGAAAAAATTGSFRLAAPGEQPSQSELTRLQTPVPSPVEPAPQRSRGALAGVAIVVLAGAAIAGWLAFGRSPVAEPSTDLRALPPPVVTRPGVQAPPPPPSTDATPAPAPPEELPTSGRAGAPPLPSSTPRRTVDDARREMTRAKTAARAVGARARASASYAAAEAAEREGARLLQAGRLGDAAAKFYQASGLFHSAELTPASPAPASAPPASPPPVAPSAPANAAPTAPPATGAPATPVQTTPPSEPIGQPAAAPTVPSPAPLPKPERPADRPPAAAAEAPAAPAEDGVRDAIRRYEQALEARSIEALKRVWPSLGGAQEDALRKEFAYARRIDVDIDGLAVTANGANAAATFVRRYQLSTDDGQRLNTNSRTTVSLHRAGGEWIIDRVRFEAIR